MLKKNDGINCFRDMYTIASEATRLEIFKVINKIKEEGPLTASGFFNVEKSTLVSMFSTILTYIIILVQFQFT